MLLGQAAAQSYPSQIFGLRGALNISTMQRQIGNSTLDRNRRPKLGWSVGAVDKILLLDSTPLYLEPGIALTNKGTTQYSSAAGSVRTVKRLGITYLQVPVDLSYHIYAGEFTIEPRLGVYYAVGLWARDVTVTRQNSQRSALIERPYDNRSLGRSDAGVRLGLGATFRHHYGLALEWETGAVNMSFKKIDRRDVNDSNFRIVLGYYF